MKIALVDSGLGLLAAAAAVRRQRPDAALLLSGDPEGMPWGPRDPQDITARALACARAAARYRPDALIVACNTASVHALDTIRAALEPDIPVIGTVPAIKPAAAAGAPFAIWATPATTGSPYQRRLIAEFAAGATVTEVPCHGLADAVERADARAVEAAVAAAAELTPPHTAALVLGCTHYELVTGPIAERLAHLGPLPLYGSADAVAAQALRRIGAAPAPDAPATGSLLVLAGGREASLPAAALRYPETRSLTGDANQVAASPDRARAIRSS
ncbi:aspartate/glutamate racemase family protein [Streptomyces harbinensis]|uniref:glutamate racemase n=1 Tax=Streptomyces harbinensis TaxID=1176198 RepID=UPI0015925977|nr:aspartate/glutamate racemase family protein [Streptomyces harbinensis]QKV68049.1 aspartate/glutamate racemase family protein [Streptomyces harbinensis]